LTGGDKLWINVTGKRDVLTGGFFDSSKLGHLGLLLLNTREDEKKIFSLLLKGDRRMSDRAKQPPQNRESLDTLTGKRESKGLNKTEQSQLPLNFYASRTTRSSNSPLFDARDYETSSSREMRKRKTAVQTPIPVPQPLTNNE
jgi:hypothetical protein